MMISSPAASVEASVTRTQRSETGVKTALSMLTPNLEMRPRWKASFPAPIWTVRERTPVVVFTSTLSVPPPRSAGAQANQMSEEVPASTVMLSVRRLTVREGESCSRALFSKS